MDRRRQPALGAGGDSLPVAPAATVVVGVAVLALSGQHVLVAAAVSVDRAQSLPAERRAGVRGHVLVHRWRSVSSGAE